MFPIILFLFYFNNLDLAIKHITFGEKCIKNALHGEDLC